MPRETLDPCWENPIWALDPQQCCTDYYLAADSAEGIPRPDTPADLAGEVAFLQIRKWFSDGDLTRDTKMGCL